MTDQFRLDGKTALITGATGSMGSDFSRTLAAAGADVVLVSRTAETLEKLAAEINGANGGRASVLACDLADPVQAGGVADRALAAAGGIDVVLHNAIPGQSGASSLLDSAPEEWSTAYDLIVWGCLALCKGLAPSMIERGSGSIITVISSTGINPTPGYAAYGMAKGSLLLLTKYMAKEWGPSGIRANCLNPGGIAKPGEEAHMQEMTKKTGVADRISMRRVGLQQEVMGTAVFLASDASSYISGQVINIDGGRI